MTRKNRRGEKTDQRKNMNTLAIKLKEQNKSSEIRQKQESRTEISVIIKLQLIPTTGPRSK